MSSGNVHQHVPRASQRLGRRQWRRARTDEVHSVTAHTSGRDVDCGNKQSLRTRVAQMPLTYRFCWDKRVHRSDITDLGCAFKYQGPSPVTAPTLGPGRYSPPPDTVRLHEPERLSSSFLATSRARHRGGASVLQSTRQLTPQRITSHSDEKVTLAHLAAKSPVTFRTAFAPSGPRIARYDSVDDMRQCSNLAAHGEQGGGSTGTALYRDTEQAV